MCLRICKQSAEQYEINSWEIAICFICTVLPACIPQKDCEKRRRELRNSLFSPRKTGDGFVIVRTTLDMFASNYIVHEVAKAKFSRLQMFAAYIYTSPFG